MSAAIYVWRTAYKAHRCDGATLRCSRIINGGDRYRECSIPPGGAGGYTGWVQLRACMRCSAVYSGPADPKAVAA